MTSEPIHAGVRPWFPGRLGRWGWLTDPVPAERMAALRVAVAVTLLLDLCTSYLPYFNLFFGPEWFGGREPSGGRFVAGHLSWSLLRWLPVGWGPEVLMGAWLASAAALLVGWRPLVSGLVAWACAVSFYNYNPGLNNGGDRLRNALLLTVAAGCTGAVWGVSAVRAKGDTRPVLVPGWPARMLFLQLAVLYFFSGYYKFISPSWQTGYAMYYVAHELAWGTAPGLTTVGPVWAHQLLSWGTLVWELGFPVLALLPGTRAVTLGLGVFFHALTLFTLEVGPFALYAISAYAIFVPWERWGRADPASPAARPADGV